MLVGLEIVQLLGFPVGARIFWLNHPVGAGDSVGSYLVGAGDSLSFYPVRPAVFLVVMSSWSWMSVVV
jgi:hypothetical protein